MNIKKPEFWDHKKPSLNSIILYPLTIFTKINNFLINIKIKKKFKKIKSICVGNIYLGGTGKTPTTIKIYEILKKKNYKVVTGKKYYSDQADEVELLKKKTKLIQGDSRDLIIQNSIKRGHKLIIFDDGLQDRNVNYNIKIACFNSSNFIGNGQLIPSGPLRESLSSIKKYDAVFLKGDFKKNKKNIKQLKKNNKKIKIFETFFRITNLKRLDKKKKYLLFSGIGNPSDFKNLLVKYKFKIVDELIYPDHYNYTHKDYLYIKKKAKYLNAKILTTEKDFVKIKKFRNNKIECVKVDLIINKEYEFLKFLKKKINEKY